MFKFCFTLFICTINVYACMFTCMGAYVYMHVMREADVLQTGQQVEVLTSITQLV